MARFRAVIAALFLLVTPLGGTAPAAAENCTGGQPTTRCENIVDQLYGGGGHNPTVVPIQACLEDRLYGSIHLEGGTAAFEVGFYYGRGAPEVVATVRNSACWTHGANGAIQHGPPGATVVAFICCDLYCGWVGGVIPARGGRVDLRPIVLPAAHDPMLSHRLPGGGYDSDLILRR